MGTVVRVFMWRN